MYNDNKRMARSIFIACPAKKKKNKHIERSLEMLN